MAIVQEYDLSLAHSQRLRSPKAAGNELPERAVEQLPESHLVQGSTTHSPIVRLMGDQLKSNRTTESLGAQSLQIFFNLRSFGHTTTGL
jgi:hypothetical protein